MGNISTILQEDCFCVQLISVLLSSPYFWFKTKEEIIQVTRERTRHSCPPRMLHVTFSQSSWAMCLRLNEAFFSKLSISAGELCWTPFTYRLLSERERKSQRQNRLKEYWRVLVVHWARPGLKLHPCLNIISGSSLPPQPEERGEESHWFQTYSLYYIPSLSLSSPVRSASEI